MRRCHYLKPNSGNELPTDAIWCDTETVGTKQPDGSERHTLKFGYAASRRTRAADSWTLPDWLRFEHRADFWDWAESKLHGKIKLYIFAHNWGFDAPVLDLFNELPRRGWKLVSSVIDSPPVILKWRRAQQSICIIDTLNIFKVPLAVIGDTLGLPKLTMPAPDASKEDWDRYGKRDVEIIMRAVMDWWQFLRTHDLGGFAPTISAQALRTFRHRFMKHQILIDDNEKSLLLARQAFKGGRTEAFYIGRVPDVVYKLDVNSMYPHIMATTPVPTKLVGTYKRSNCEELQQILQSYAVCADVTVKTDEAAYPIIHDNKLIFPVGHYRVQLTTPELIYALLCGHIEIVHAVAVYEAAIIFKDYVEFFQTVRNAAKARGDEGEADRCKRMGNHLFGKFGQNGRVFNIIDHTPDLQCRSWSEVDAQTGIVHKYRQYAGVIEEWREEGESRDSHPAIAAHITAAARMHLYSLMRSAGLGNYFYCDTDSLWVNATGLGNLRLELDNIKLGKLKLEGTHEAVTIYGLKDYVIDDKRKTKGVKAKAVQISEHTFEQDQFSNLKGLLRDGDLTAPVIKRMSKTLSRKYTKGTVLQTGWVLPLRIDRG